MAFNVLNLELNPTTDVNVSLPRIFDYEDSGELIANIDSAYFSEPEAFVAFTAGTLIAVQASNGAALFVVTGLNTSMDTVTVVKLYDLT